MNMSNSMSQAIIILKEKSTFFALGYTLEVIQYNNIDLWNLSLGLLELQNNKNSFRQIMELSFNFFCVSSFITKSFAYCMTE